MPDHLMSSSNTVRNFTAWFLLLTLCLQRIVGFVGTEAAYTIEVEVPMNEIEQRIADRYESETGHEPRISLFGDHEMNEFIYSGYNAPLVISEEAEEGVLNYSIKYSPKTILLKFNTESKKPVKEHPLNASKSFNDRLFSLFYFWEDCLPAFSFSHSSDVWCAMMISDTNYFISVPSPPPRLI